MNQLSAKVHALGIINISINTMRRFFKYFIVVTLFDLVATKV